MDIVLFHYLFTHWQ